MTAPNTSHAPRTVRAAGERALLIEARDLADVLDLHAHLSAHPLLGQEEVLAAASTVLVTFSDPRSAQAATRRVAALEPDAARRSEAATVTIDVVYDGEDIAEAAALCGMSPAALVDAHTAATWTGAFGGFAPGFTYCAAEPSPFDVPRRTSPRTAVPPGSVAIAGRFSAVYPRRSPGGWQLLGRTEATMWDLERDQPALIRPGDAVRYRAVRGSARAASTPSGPDAGPSHAAAGTGNGHGFPPSLVVADPGAFTLVQDLGRPGHGDLGVPHAGAVDALAARTANALVGNGGQAAVLETALGGLAVRAQGQLVLALAGAPADARVSNDAGDSGPVPHGRAVPLYDGQTLTLDAPSAGLRTYLAVRGGIDLPATLGSRSSDTLSGLGPAALAAGDVLPIGPSTGCPAVDPAPAPARALPAPGGVVTLRATPGPRTDWFDAAGIAALTEQEWTVTPRSDRVGVRLGEPSDGRTVTRAREGELASEGVVLGSLQVPPSGEPVLFLADHPVTGGYPIIAVVREEDLPLAAQLPAGARVRIHLTDPAPLPGGAET